jgi:hypothetical protein
VTEDFLGFACLLQYDDPQLVIEVRESSPRRFIGQRIGRDYQPLLDSEGQQALADLKQQFGTSKILCTIRNNFSFHFPKEEMIEEAFQEASSAPNFDGEWNVLWLE